ncbi:MAG: hypothetical protein Q4B40_01350 [Clostridia bacterium]|nr:hypothetical protein [Clostridia bacterium]
MKNIKSIISVFVICCLCFCMIGCAEDDEFDPIGVRVVENISGKQYEGSVNDKETTQKLWNRFIDLDIDEEEKGEMGTAYIYFCFYDDAGSNLGIFTMYENGSCCLGEDFETFYVIPDGVQVYTDLCGIYTEYKQNNKEK